MLGRFVLPAARLRDFAAGRRRAPARAGRRRALAPERAPRRRRARRLVPRDVVQPVARGAGGRGRGRAEGGQPGGRRRRARGAAARPRRLRRGAARRRPRRPARRPAPPRRAGQGPHRRRRARRHPRSRRPGPLHRGLRRGRRALEGHRRAAPPRPRRAGAHVRAGRPAGGDARLPERVRGGGLRRRRRARRRPRGGAAGGGRRGLPPRRGRPLLAPPARLRRTSWRDPAATSRRPSARAPSPSRWPTSAPSGCSRDHRRPTARTTPRCAAGSSRRTTPPPTSPSRTCRSASSVRGEARPARVGCAIGDQVLDLAACAERGLLRGMPSDVEDACRGTSLNALMALEPRRARDAAPPPEPPAARRGRLRDRARRRGAACSLRQADVEMLLPATGRRLHRLLRLGLPRHERREDAAPRQPAAAELQVGADRLPRPRLVARGERHAREAAERPDRAGRRRAARLRPEPQPRLRARGRRLPRPGQRARRARPAGGGRGPDLRPLPRQRLVGPRPAEVGVPAAGPLPREELRHLGEPLGRHPRGARSLPRARLRPARGRPAAAAVPRPRGERGARRDRPAARGAPLVEGDARAGAAAVHAEPQQPARPLLDARADGGAPRLERLQPPARRPDRERDGVGRGRRRRGAASSSGRGGARSRSRSPPARSGASWRTATR